MIHTNESCRLLTIMEIESESVTKKRNRNGNSITYSLMSNILRNHIDVINNTNLYTIDNDKSANNDFIILKVSNENCRFDYIKVSIEDIKGIDKTWIALYVKRNLYLTDRQSCLQCKIIDDCIEIDIKCIMRIPLPIENNTIITKKLDISYDNNDNKYASTWNLYGKFIIICMGYFYYSIFIIIINACICRGYYNVINRS